MSGATLDQGGAAADRKTEWRPERLIAPPPLFVWPPRPAGFLRWLFGWNGYLFPWNAIYVAIAAFTWLYLTPDFAGMTEFHAGWVLLLFERNVALLLLVAGAWHARLYMQKAQGIKYKYNPRWLSKNTQFLFNNQLYDNLFWTFSSAVPVWTAYEAVTLWAQANQYIPSMSWHEHPVWCAVILLLIPLWRELHFYCIHRLIHWPPLYRTVHHLHHKNVNIGPWSGMAMHPVEHVLYMSAVLIHWIVPSNPLHVIFNLQHLAFAPSQGHTGFYKIVLKDGVEQETGNFMHYLHHRYFEVNYGGDGSIPIDKWFGTFHDGSDEAEARMNKRVLGRNTKA
jgi:sterol desaturase/sphingolipid hydroxylase (fatty acid hydroxylase superfamily)